MLNSTFVSLGEGNFDVVCEPDEYSSLVTEVKKSGIIKNHRKGLSSYKNSFSGKDFVDWYMKEKEKGERKWNKIHIWKVIMTSC